MNPTHFYESADSIAQDRNFYGPEIGIHSIMLFYYDTERHFLSGFQASYDINGSIVEARRHGKDFMNDAFDQVR